MLKRPMRTSIVAALLLLTYSWTALVRWPGGDEYSLVLKPFPSAFHTVPHLEERDWNRRIGSGELPTWLATGSYVTLAASGDELETPAWFWIYTGFCLLASGALLAAIAASLKALWQGIASRKVMRQRLPGADGSDNPKEDTAR